MTWFVSLPFKIVKRLYRWIKTWYLNKKVTSGHGKIIINDPFFKVKIIVDQGGEFVLNGKLIFERHLEGGGITVIRVSSGARLTIDGDFMIGNGVRISLSKNSELYFGGADQDDLSGITENTKLMVRESIKIGKDFICAWDVFITDCDWHSVYKNGDLMSHTAPVEIGNKVWFTSGCKILKGSVIGDNSIVTSNSVVSNKRFENNSIISGNPAISKKSELTWKRVIS